MSIKSRRLFAILVITAMVLTMLPMTAFAVPYSYGASSVSVDKTSVEAGNEVTFTVRFREADGTPVATPDSFIIKSSRDTEQITKMTDSDGTDLGVTFSAIALATGAKVTDGAIILGDDGILKFKLTSLVPGSATITVCQALRDEVDGDPIGVIGEKTITFTEKKADDISLDVDDVDNTVQAGEEYELVATVETGNFPVEGASVTFYEKKDSGSWRNIGSVETNADGEAKKKVSQEKAADYSYYVKAGSLTTKDYPLVVDVEPADPFSINADKETVYAEVDKAVKVYFIMEDRYGNKIGIVDSVDFTIKDPDNKTVTDDGTGVDDKGEKVYVEFEPDKKGEYKVTATIAGTSIKATTVVNTEDFGDIEALELALQDEDGNKVDPPTISSDPDGSVTGYAVSVKLVDENGIKRDFDESSDEVVFNTSDATLATVDKYEGALTVKKAASGTVVITAVHLDTGLTNSIEIVISGAPVAMEAEVEVDDLKADVTLTLIDKAGLRANEGEDAGYRVIAPSGVTVEDEKNFKNGEATFTLVADEYGTYTIQVVSDLGIAKTFDVTFGAPKPEVGANSLTLFIGSKGYVADGAGATSDAAPFIEDGRTFVPVRLIAEAFGAEADWTPKDAAVEVVTLTRDDIQITINIGAYTIDVVRDGVAETVPTDVAAFIKDGRTFLPFRVIAEAFGAEVDWGPKDGPTEWVTFTQ